MKCLVTHVSLYSQASVVKLKHMRCNTWKTIITSIIFTFLQIFNNVFSVRQQNNISLFRHLPVIVIMCLHPCSVIGMHIDILGHVTPAQTGIGANVCLTHQEKTPVFLDKSQPIVTNINIILHVYTKTTQGCLETA